MISLARRKYLVFLTLASLSIFVIVANRFLSTNLSVDNIGFVDDADAIPAAATQRSSFKDENPTTTAYPTWSKNRKVAFLKPQKLAAVPTPEAYSPGMSKISAVDIEAVGAERDRRQRPQADAAGARYIPQHRIVHLDLKGAMPKLSYLKAVFPMIKDAGATAVMIEYEDMFPYWGPLKNISAKNALTAADVQNILTMAEQNDLLVVPLVQTFGHLEFVLKLDEFKHLREVPIYPQSICPTNEESWKLVSTMIDQGKHYFDNSTLDMFYSNHRDLSAKMSKIKFLMRPLNPAKPQHQGFHVKLVVRK